MFFQSLTMFLSVEEAWLGFSSTDAEMAKSPFFPTKERFRPALPESKVALLVPESANSPPSHRRVPVINTR